MAGGRAMGREGSGGGTGVEEVESRGRCPGMNVSSAVTVADGE